MYPAFSELRGMAPPCTFGHHGRSRISKGPIMAIPLLIAGCGLLLIASPSFAIFTTAVFSVAAAAILVQAIRKMFSLYSELPQIFRASAIGICYIDTNFKIRRINDYLLSTLGLEKDAVIGENCYRVLRSNSCLTSKCPLIQTMGGESPFKLKEEFRETQKGRILACSITSAPLYGRGGRLYGIVKTIQDITERKRFEAILTHTATHDSLTDLPNRTVFMDRTSQAIARTKRTRKSLAIVFVDLDRFKEINDSFGHDTGDIVLRIVAARLRSILRDTDTVARIGGDEFLVLVNELTLPENALEIVQKILDILQQPVKAGSEILQVGASIGWAVYPEDGEDGWTLIRHADLAMYRAKKSAENRFQRYATVMENALPDEITSTWNHNESLKTDVHYERAAFRNIEGDNNTRTA